jgi:hypothetical protein
MQENGQPNQEITPEQRRADWFRAMTEAIPGPRGMPVLAAMVLRLDVDQFLQIDGVADLNLGIMVLRRALQMLEDQRYLNLVNAAVDTSVARASLIVRPEIPGRWPPHPGR